MDSEKLKHAQWKTLATAFHRMSGYLHAVLVQMDKLRFPPADPLRPYVAKAHDAAHSLWVHTHYKACENLHTFRRDSDPTLSDDAEAKKDRSEHLAPGQILAVHDRVAVLQDYLRRLTERMDSMAFPETDPLRVAVASGAVALEEFAAAVMRIASKVEAQEIARGLGGPEGLAK